MKSLSSIKPRSLLTRNLLLLLNAAILTTSVTFADTSDQQAKREVNFKAADVTGDGALTPTEFRAFINANADDNLGKAAQIKRFGAYDRAFTRLDTDNSGTVSWSEVTDALARAG